MPHGNTVYDVARSEVLTVLVGDRGQLYTSMDHLLWTPRATGTTRSLRAVCFFQDRLVATGAEGVVITGLAATPQDLQLVPLETSDWLEGVAASDAQVVAVGDNGAIYASPDALNWTRRSTAWQTWWRGVAHGGGIFVVVGEDGLILRSADTQTWNQVSSGTGEHLNRVIWDGSRFVAVGNSGVVLSSSNGSHWSPLAGSGATGSLFTVASGDDALLVGGTEELRLFEGGVWQDQINGAAGFPAPLWTYYASAWDGVAFLIGGRTGMIVEGFRPTPTDDYAWLEAADSQRQWLWDLRAIAGRLVAVGDFGTILTSDHGQAWELELTPESVRNTVLLGVAGGAGMTVAVGTQGTILTSPDGIQWNVVQPAPTADDLQGITFHAGRFYATSGAGEVFSSPDGLSWNLAAKPVNTILSGLAHDGQQLLAVGDQGVILASADGSTWAPRNSGVSGWIYRVRHLGGHFVAVGQEGLLLTSPDGSEWTLRSSGTTAWLTDAAWFDGRFHVVGTQGTLLVSDDLAGWASAPPPTRESLFALAATDQQLVAAGVEGLILRGQRGALQILSYARDASTNAFLVSSAPGNRFDIEGAADLHAWSVVAGGEMMSNEGLAIVEETRPEPPPQELFRGRLR